MAVPVVVPSVGESIVEGRIARWAAADGSAVKVDQLLYEIETDKATQEITAPAAGVLKIVVKEGEIVKVGQTVGEIDPAGVLAGRASDGNSQPPPAGKPAEGNGQPSLARPANKTEELRASPAASAMIRDHNLEASSIPATGPGNRITKEDVLTALAKPAAAPQAAVAVPKAAPAPVAPIQRSSEVRETRQPMNMIRKRTAERLLQSQTQTATLTTFNEVDMTGIMDVRAKYNEKFEKKHGVKLGFMSVFVKAAVEALKAFPLANARIDGNDIVHQHFYDISVAVSSEKGLFVPVIRDADQLGFAEIEKEIAALAKKARDGKIGLADMQGGTFTITNGGIFGSMMSTPILNPPQTAILGMHATQKRAVVVNDQIVIRPMMYLALSYDHRLIDGREAVQFLVRIKECVENPERMLFGI
jgi:2-oxoglutarate dehydrogenase E2 component (dihydrolipoamide succinyltransferase)